VKYLLDTNTCIRVLNASGAATLVERWKAARPSQIRLCSVVKAELLFGAEKSAKRELVHQKLQVFFSRFKSMPFDDAAAQTYGVIRAALEQEGRLIGPNDMLIAAIALANGLTVVTHNTAELGRVPGLLLEDWEA
jgi:tRNA(fMet)-specific endonuclease VapC